MSNFAHYSDELAPLQRVREHLPEGDLQEYEAALDFLEDLILDAHECSKDITSLDVVPGLLDDLARALRSVR